MQIVSYLFFKDNATEAFDFYAGCLGGKIEMKVTMGEMPDADALSPEVRGLVAHVRLAVGDAVLMGSDWWPDHRTLSRHPRQRGVDQCRKPR